MILNQNRQSFSNLLEKFQSLKNQTNLDDQTDGIIECENIGKFFELIDMKKTEEEIIEYIKQNDPEQKGYIELPQLMFSLKEYLDLNNTKKEFIQAFETFDVQKTGKINLHDFRLIMKKYGKISDEELDEMTLSIFEVKKLQQVEPNSVVNYLEFANKLFPEI